MKQVININFQGRIVPIEVTAYEILKNYIESLTQHFAAEEGKEEIINDIENRIGELFQERIKAGATCIEDDDVNAIIKSIGRPQDFDDAQPTSNTENANQSSNQKQTQFTTASGRKRLFRDENHKLVGGVCSGIANYFDVDIAVIRVLFLILLFSFGIGFIPYIILWIVVPSTATTVIGSRRKKLYRDTDEKYVGGVSSGLAHYFGINVWIPRAIFLLPLLSLIGKNRWGHYWDYDVFNLTPGPVLLYIILWIVLPEAKTTAEKLEMKGEKVDMNTIKESVVEEMKGMQQRVQKMGKEVSTVVTEKSKVFGSEATAIARKNSNVFADIITFIVKFFVYSILAVVGISLLIALFTLGVVALNNFSYKDFLLTSGTQNLLAWGTLIFFILAPMIAVITWIIRKITKVKTGGKMLALSFSAMWVVGWVCVSFLVASVSKDFKYNSELAKQNITLLNPNVNALEITNGRQNKRYSRNNWFNNDMFDINGDNTKATLKNIRINIVKATADSFSVTVEKLATGRKEAYADSLAALINYNISQQDTVLTIDKGIEINTTDKFRNQRVIITIHVPVGKRIKVQKNIAWLNQIYFNGFGIENRNYDDMPYENIETNWQTGVWYVMGKDGLQNLDGTKANAGRRTGVNINDDGIDIQNDNERIRINENGIKTETNKNNNENGRYRYNEVPQTVNDEVPQTINDTVTTNLQKMQQKIKDSLESEKKKIDKQLEKYNSTTGSTNMYTPNKFLIGFFN